MSETATTFTGPLGSTVHVLRADADTIAELAAIDWSLHFRRVCLDPVRGIITLMSPSRIPHEDLSKMLDDIVDVAAGAPSLPVRDQGAAKSPASAGRTSPPAPGMEPDCAFYVGDRAKSYFAALSERVTRRKPPSLNARRRTWSIEVEITNADEGKAARYGEMGVREMWRLHGRKGTKELRAEFLALAAGDAAPRLIWRLHRCSVKASRPTTCARQSTGVRVGRNHDESKGCRSPRSLAGGSMRACGYARSRRNTPPTEQHGQHARIPCSGNTRSPRNHYRFSQPR